MPARTISNSARQTPFLSVADCARPAAPDRSGVRMDCNRGNLRAVVGSLSEPTAAAGRGPPVEVVAAACAPSRPRSRAFGPFTVVRRRRPTASGPLGVRVGRSAALRGPSEPAGVPQGTPGNQNSARQRRSQHHTRTAGPARFAHACPEPRGTCPHASATENSPLTNGEEPCYLSHTIAAGSRGLRDRLQRWYFFRLRRID